MAALMAGCAATNKPQTDAEYKQSITQATETLASKGSDQAVAQFQEIAVRNPSRGEPWSYIAKIRFDEQKYGEAIVAADEALNRDSEDFTAKTVRAVGGLRVAMQSLADLRADALLAGNARTDAVALAAAMRETLGQDVLFPEGRKPPRGGGTRPPPKRQDAPPVSPAASAAPATQPGQATSPTQAGGAGQPAVPPARQPAVQSAGSGQSAPPAQPAGGRAPDPFGNLLKP
ncbi:hypothetical protein [Achromobacter sp. UMC71]|uniref:hypothetical protein n=1 Tax=Achromobacter sp. UMC71 TaxID=1862320 RepID=UPI001603F60C|nr:hypothetical protein [Achromobacter sp. UMC71]MBB1626941.1 hypothetical protein [Achromobacter sp. UMC71]